MISLLKDTLHEDRRDSICARPDLAKCPFEALTTATG
jgi:hypothetical protein